MPIFLLLSFLTLTYAIIFCLLYARLFFLAHILRLFFSLTSSLLLSSGFLDACLLSFSFPLRFFRLLCLLLLLGNLLLG